MLSKPFDFKEVNAYRVSAECKAGRCKDCDGSIPRAYDEKHDHPCDHECHGSFHIPTLPYDKKKRNFVKP